MKNILVVGGAGYIGSHMVLGLQDIGYFPIVFDNLSRGFSDAVGTAPLITGDLRSQQDIEACFTEYQIDLVMHFAALAYVGESVSEPEMYYQNNVMGALNLLGVMRRHGVDKFVFSSTCATYGEPNYLPICELHEQSPVNPYGRTKLIIEQALRDYSLAYDLQSVSLRYFNAAGGDADGRVGERHDPETHLIPLVLLEAMRLKAGGDPADTGLQVFGGDFDTPDGSCVRDYIHVSDLCRAHLMAAQRLLTGAVEGADFFNLANGVGFSVLDVIRVCSKVTGESIKYTLMNRRAGDPAMLVGDSSKAADVLGWAPDITALEDIIRSAWNWMTRE